MISNHEPVGDGFVSRAICRFHALDRDFACTRTDNILVPGHDPETLGRIATFRIMCGKPIRLVLAVGNRQHDAIALAVNVGSCQYLGIDFIQCRFQLRADLLVNNQLILFPIAKLPWNEVFENDGRFLVCDQFCRGNRHSQGGSGQHGHSQQQVRRFEKRHIHCCKAPRPNCVFLCCLALTPYCNKESTLMISVNATMNSTIPANPCTNPCPASSPK